MAKIFISYGREDRDKVAPLYILLRLLGYEPWMDDFDLVAGQRWESAITSAIRRADLVLLALSSSSYRSGFVHKEMRLALNLADRYRADESYLIPVKLDSSPYPDELHEYQYVDLFNANGLLEVVRAIEAGLAQRGRETAGTAARKLFGWIAQHGSDIRPSQRGLTFRFIDRHLECMFDTHADRMRLFARVAGRSEISDSDVRDLLTANYTNTADGRYACDGNTVFGSFLHPLGDLSEAQFYRGACAARDLILHFGGSNSHSDIPNVGARSSHGSTKEQLVGWIESEWDYEKSYIDDAIYVDMSEVRLTVTLREEPNEFRIESDIKFEGPLDSSTLLDSNFHKMLDVRYALHDGRACVVYNHGLSEMTPDLVRSALNQAITGVQTFGGEFSSGPWQLRRLDG